MIQSLLYYIIFLCELQEATTAYPCHTLSFLPSLLHPPCTESANKSLEPSAAHFDDKIFHDHSRDPRELHSSCKLILVDKLKIVYFLV